MKVILSLLVAVAGLNTALAGSKFVDDARLGSCSRSSGTIELREADNGSLSIQLRGLDSNRCNKLRFYDYYSKRTIKSYSIKGTNYTLSKAQAGELQKDCKLGIEVEGPRGYEAYSINLWWCSPAKSYRPAPSRGGDYSFQWSNNRNCKLMINGEYSNRNVSDRWCQAASGKDVVSYEWSRKGNCKVMINGQYANRNVSDSYCEAKF